MYATTRKSSQLCHIVWSPALSRVSTVKRMQDSASAHCVSLAAVSVGQSTATIVSCELLIRLVSRVCRAPSELASNRHICRPPVRIDNISITRLPRAALAVRRFGRRR